MAFFCSGSLALSMNQTADFIPIYNPVLQEPFASQTGDFNEDGHADLAISNQLRNQSYITVLLGNGQGSFPLYTNYPVTGSSIRDLEIADFNQDGHEDICAVMMLSSSVSMFFGDGQGHFVESGVYQTAGFSEYATTGDFNEDDYPDLAVSHWVTGEMSLLLNDCQGGFEEAEVYDLYGGTKEIDIGDFDEDGHVDIAVATMAYNFVVILFGDGSGEFDEDLEEFVDVDYDAYVVRVADFNDDKHDDMAVGTKHSFLLLLGDGEGGFTRSFETEVFDPHAINAWDFNEDGNCDAVVSMTQCDCFKVFLGDGEGGFQDCLLTDPLLTAPRSMDAADFNEDGHMDIAAANEGSDEIGVLMNQVGLLEITPVKTRTLYSLGDQATFQFWIFNPQDSTVRGTMWFTLKDASEERLIDPAFLLGETNPFQITIPPGYYGQHTVHFIIPPDLDEKPYQFYVNTGFHSYAVGEPKLPDDGSPGVGNPILWDPIVWSSGKFPIRVITTGTQVHNEGIDLR